MTVVHMVLFKFQADVTTAHKEEFVRQLRKLRDLPCVVNQRLIVGGPTITDPIERSKGFHYALLSFHQDRAALKEYQASKEHHEVTSKWLWPYKEDVMRFDFEVDEADEHLVQSLATSALASANGKA